MATAKRERIEKILAGIRAAAPFPTGVAARAFLETVMKDVEDSFSGIPEDPDAAAAPASGRMYPPHDRFEIPAASPHVRIFKQARHRTLFGDNGAIKIVYADGKVELDLAGLDGKSVAELLSEKYNEFN